MNSRVWTTVLIAVLLANCRDHSTEPDSKILPLRVVAGGGVSDTIQAKLTQALIVEVRDAAGATASGRIVRFEPLRSQDPKRRTEMMILVSPIAVDRYWDLTIDTTDAQGRAKAVVAFGTVAGEGKVRVVVPDLNLVDTVSFTVRPGNPVKLGLLTRDTTVQAGATYSLNSSAIDRFGNSVAGETITYKAGAGVASVSSAGVVTAGPSIARTEIVLSWRGLVDTARVSVLPRLGLVGTKYAGLERKVGYVNLDGSNPIELATVIDELPSPDAVKSTGRVVFYQGDPSAAPASVWIIDPSSSPRRLLPSTANFLSTYWPRWSADGQWVFFVALKPSAPSRTVWRVRPDGSELDSLGTINPPTTYAPPAASPDGKTVTVEDRTGIKVLDVSTHSSRIINTFCGVPRYSPDGTKLACVRTGILSVMNADGSGERVVDNPLPSFNYEALFSVDWSPDGKWLLVHLARGVPRLVSAADGTVLTLTALSEYTQLSFVH